MTDVPYGYLPPADAYQQAAPVGFDPDDPLVNPQFAGINGWFNRISGMFKRSWKSMAAIFGITYLVPNIVITVLGAAAQFLFASRFLAYLPNQPTRYEDPGDLFAKYGVSIFAVVGIGIGLAILLYLVQLAGYGAATYAVTREAAGQRVSLGEALGYGFRRAPGLFGWQFLAGILIVLSLVACFVPFLYVFPALALVGPIYLFERRNPIGRSFSIFNNNLGRVLGRLALMLCAIIGGAILNGIIGLIGSAATGTLGNTTIDLNATIVSSTLTSLLGVIIELPLTMIMFAGILLTYTEQRGYEAPVNSAILAGEL